MKTILLYSFFGVISCLLISCGELTPRATNQGSSGNPDAPGSCSIPWGGVIADGQSITAFQSGSVASGQSCTSQTRQCNNGQLSGSYSFQSCSVQVPGACTLPWGGSITSGQSVTAYEASSVPNGQICTSQTRQCNNGQLSGSYSYKTCSVQPPATGNAPVEIIVEPSFETAGVYIKLPSGAASNVSAKLFIRKQSDSTFKEAHFFTRYDLNNMASSLFDLSSGTAYEAQVQYTDASGTKTKNAFFNTKVDTMALPAATRVVNVSNSSQLNSAISNARAGDHIVLANGVYNSFTISKKGTAAAPIVIRGASSFDQFNPPSNSNRAIISGGTNAAYFNGAAYVILDSVEVRDSSNVGVYLRSASHITVQNSYIHDGGDWDVLISKGNEYSDINEAGYHIIQNNLITSTKAIAGCPRGNSGCSGITYYGIQVDNRGGAANVIRNNKITRHVDNVAPCGDESSTSGLTENTAQVLRLTSNSGQWLNHDTEIYENEIFDALDDDIETDGICVNLKIYKNRTGKKGAAMNETPKNAITIAPVMPGPIFIMRNHIQNYEESAFKMNTNVGGSNSTRNLYIYHNTIVKPHSSYALINLWYGMPGEHSANVKNIQFKNNIIASLGGSACTDAYNRGATQPTFDYNLWYTTRSGSIFSWFNGSSNRSASNIEGFRSISGQEENGLFGNPNLDSNYGITSSSPAIDKGLKIPGINDGFRGSAPDIGAQEL